jgi:acylphosphatase
MSQTKSIHARVTGRVQGVSFRAWTRDEAERRGLDGWVRNESDGTVCAVIHGPEDRVDDMARALRRGPAGAQVSEVQTEIGNPPDNAGFEIRR